MPKSNEDLRSQDLPEHDPRGPSSLGRLMGCPGSLRLSRNDPDVETEWARSGTDCHQRLHEYFTAVEESEVNLSDEQQELVDSCIVFVDEKLSRHKVLRTWVEEHVTLLDGPRVVNYGRADLLILAESKANFSHTLFVFDFKFGRKVHRHSLVLQLANYAAAALTSLTGLWEKEIPVKAYAYFPLLGESFTWRAKGKEDGVAAVVKRIDEIIQAAESGAAAVVPGVWCDYCKHLPLCAKVREEGQVLAKSSAGSLVANPERAIELFDMGALAEKQNQALRQAIKEVLKEAPGAFPGLRYSETNGRRKVDDLDVLRDRLLTDGWLTKIEFDSCVETTVKPTVVEKAFMKRHFDETGDGLAKKQVKDTFKKVAGDSISQPKIMQLRRVF